MKPSKCKVCRCEYTKRQVGQIVCGYQCALVHARSESKRKADRVHKAERKQHREQLEAVKPLSYFKAKAQEAFNAYIRERDKDLGCISCGTKKDVQYCAGHFYTRGARPWLAFNEDNVHKQCNKYCNQALSGNVINYRPNLIRKIGLERVEALDNLASSDVRLTREDYIAITKTYRQKLRQLKNG